MRRLSSAVLIITILIVCIGLFNYIPLQAKMGEVVKGDARNHGIAVRVHYGAYLNTKHLVYDLRDVDSDKAMLDVFRVLLQFAEAVSETEFDTVTLCFRGRPRFELDGSYFREIGTEYSWQNPVYTSRTFPEHLRLPDGARAFAPWSGGILAVVARQMDDFSEFHMDWYMREVALGG